MPIARKRTRCVNCAAAEDGPAAADIVADAPGLKAAEGEDDTLELRRGDGVRLIDVRDEETEAPWSRKKEGRA